MQLFANDLHSCELRRNMAGQTFCPLLFYFSRLFRAFLHVTDHILCLFYDFPSPDWDEARN